MSTDNAPPRSATPLDGLSPKVPDKVLWVPDPSGHGFIERRIPATGTSGLVMAR